MSFVGKLMLITIGTGFPFVKEIGAQSLVQQNGISCSITLLGETLQWVKMTAVKPRELSVAKGIARLPLKYSVYTTDDLLLKRYLTGLKDKQGNIILPVADEAGCSEFIISGSGTLSAELAAKYPEIVSLKGTDMQDKSSLLRLNYNGAELNAEFTRKGVTYILAPWKKRSKTYYLLYKKEDSGTKREPFTER